MKLTRDTAAAVMAIAAICIVVGLGFWKTRGPGSQRLIARIGSCRWGRSGAPMGVSCGLTSAVSPGRTTIVSV